MNIQCKVYVLKEATGEVRQAPNDYADPDNLYHWTEGNFSCDCNKAIIFGETEEVECGDCKYSVNLINLASGEFVLQQFSDAQVKA